MRDTRQNTGFLENEPFTPLEASRTAATVFVCGLCGTRFTHGRQVCGACPFHAGCDLVSCPHCGYSFPRTSRVVDWIRRLLGRAVEGRT